MNADVSHSSPELQDTRRYRLKAFPEIHPLNFFFDTFGYYLRIFSSVYDEQMLRELCKLKDTLFNAANNSPEILRSTGFMDEYAKNLANFIWSMHMQCYMGPKEKIFSIYRLINVKENVEESRRVIDHELGLIDSGGLEILYIEGGPANDPLSAYANRSGIAVISLDDEHYLEKFECAIKDGPQAERNFQIERDAGWASKIQPGDHIEKALLVAGGKHVFNGFGLTDRLAEKGIDVDLLPGYKPAFGCSLIGRAHEILSEIGKTYNRRGQ